MLSLPHLIIIFLVALVVFGPEKLPELARNFGKVMAEFRRATGDLRSTFEEHMRDLEREAGDRRMGTGQSQDPASSVFSKGSNSTPDHVIASTPLSARPRPNAPPGVAEAVDSLSTHGGNSGESAPSIGEANRKRLADGAAESVPDPAASLAPPDAHSTEHSAENGSKSEIVSDGHRSP